MKCLHVYLRCVLFFCLACFSLCFGFQSIFVHAATSDGALWVNGQRVCWLNGTESIPLRYDCDFVTPVIESVSEYSQSVDNGVVSYASTISGYYDVAVTVDLGASNNNAYYGYFSIDSKLRYIVGSANFRSGDTGLLTFGQPIVRGILPYTVGASATASNAVYGLDGDSNGAIVEVPFYTTVSLNGYNTANTQGTIGFTVRIPFSVKMVVQSNALDTYSKLDFWRSVMSPRLRVWWLYDYSVLSAVPISGGLQSSLDAIQENQQQQLEKSEEQLKEQKKQGEEKRGFFKTIVDWITGFPNMLVRVVIPDNDVIPGFLNDMRDFLNQHLGFVMFPFDLFGKFLDVFSASSYDSSLVFPAFSIMGHKVWDSQKFDLSSVFYDLGSAGDTLQDALYFISSVSLIGAFISLCYKKFSSVVKGSEAE